MTTQTVYVVAIDEAEAIHALLEGLYEVHGSVNSAKLQIEQDFPREPQNIFKFEIIGFGAVLHGGRDAEEK